MSEPTTEAGRALMEAMFGEAWNMPDSPGDAIAAIEQEAVRAYKERLAAGVRKLDELPVVWGRYDSHTTAVVDRTAVLRLIEDTK